MKTYIRHNSVIKKKEKKRNLTNYTPSSVYFAEFSTVSKLDFTIGHQVELTRTCSSIITIVNTTQILLPPSSFCRCDPSVVSLDGPLPGTRKEGQLQVN